jgi:ABC-2 type transport system permease protein
MIAILKRELQAYFITPIGYLYMGLFLLLSGVYFVIGNLLNQSSQFSGFLSQLLFIYLFAVPLLTMRLFSEEKRQKTDQLLLTSPVSVTGIVCGKFLAALILYTMAMAVTLLYAIVIDVYGDMLWPETAGSYIGFLFLGAAYISVGILVSASTENQLTAALVAFFVLLLVLLLDSIAQIIPADTRSGLIFAVAAGAAFTLFVFLNTRNLFITAAVFLVCAGAIAGFWFGKQAVFTGLPQKFLGWLSINRRYQPFAQGLLKVDALVYYASFSGLLLFLTIRIIEKRRWN